MSGHIIVKFVFFLLLLASIAVLMYYGISSLVASEDPATNDTYAMDVTDLTVASVLLFVVMFAMFAGCYKKHSSDSPIPPPVIAWMFGTKWALTYILIFGGVAIIAVTGQQFNPASPAQVVSLTVGIIYTFFALLMITNLLSKCKKMSEIGSGY